MQWKGMVNASLSSYREAGVLEMVFECIILKNGF